MATDSKGSAVRLQCVLISRFGRTALTSLHVNPVAYAISISAGHRRRIDYNDSCLVTDCRPAPICEIVYARADLTHPCCL